MTSSEFHLKAQPHLQMILQTSVVGFSTVCSCKIKGMNCEITFNGVTKDDNFFCEDAMVVLHKTPLTPQTYKRHVVTIETSDVAKASSLVGEAIAKIEGLLTVSVKRVGAGWIATVNEKPHMKSGGTTHLEAIGNLVHTYKERFGVDFTVVA